MYQLSQTSGFKKDIKRARKRGLDIQLLDKAITLLVNDGKLQKNTNLINLKESIQVFGNVTSSRIGY